MRKRKNKMAFVLGSGPSLHDLDFDLIRPYTTIAVNSAIMKVPDSNYYFTCDFGMVVWKSWLTLRNLKCKLILYNVDVGFRYLEYLTGLDTFEGIDDNRISYFDMKDTDLIMNKNTCDMLIRGSTSTQVAVHYAHALGYSPIVLIGCDCKYVDGKYHYYDFPGEIRDDLIKPEYGNFKPKNLIVKQGDSNRYLRGHVVCWQKIKLQNPNINIIDTSKGKLNMFLQMPLRKVIEQYG